MNNNQTIIRPMKGRREPGAGPDAIMISIPWELNFMVEISRAKRGILEGGNPFKLYLASSGNKTIAIAGPLLGAPQGAIILERLIALGAKRIWVMGHCGSLQPECVIGDLLIPSTALPEEGTSMHYPLDGKDPETDPLMNDIIADSLKKEGLNFKKGPVWTTDAFYRETKQKVIDYGKRGVLAVEMEMSALITIAAYRSVKLAGILIVSDELFSLKWVHGFKEKILKQRGSEVCRLILDICKNV